MGPMNDPRVCLSWATRGLPLMGHTGVCHNFPRGAHVFFLSKDTMGPTWNPCVFAICITHVGPICNYHYHYGATHGLPCVFTICIAHVWLSGVPDLWDRNEILSGGDLPHYQVPHCIRVFFILFDLCLFITIFNFILNYVLIVTFWIFSYH